MFRGERRVCAPSRSWADRWGTFTFEVVTLVGGQPAGQPVSIPVTTTGFPPQGSGTASLPSLVAGQAYRLTEVDQASWIEGPISCNQTPAGGGDPVPIDPANFTPAPVASIACTAANATPPTLALQKQVDSEIVSPLYWTLVGTPSGGDGPTLSGAGSVAATEVPVGRDYVLSEASEPPYSTEFEPGSWTCIDANGGTVTVSETVDGTATLSGLQGGQAVTCTMVNSGEPDVSVEKTPRTTTQNADGTWTIVYDVVVTNGRQAVPTRSWVKDASAPYFAVADSAIVEVRVKTRRRRPRSPIPRWRLRNAPRGRARRCR